MPGSFVRLRAARGVRDVVLACRGEGRLQASGYLEVGMLGKAEAPLRRAETGGLAPEGAGWFIVNVAEARAVHTEQLGDVVTFEGDRSFPEFGVNLRVLRPGQPNALYHREDAQEAFLVLKCECLAIVEPGACATGRRLLLLAGGHHARLRGRRRRTVRRAHDGHAQGLARVPLPRKRDRRATRRLGRARHRFPGRGVRELERLARGTTQRHPDDARPDLLASGTGAPPFASILERLAGAGELLAHTLGRRAAALTLARRASARLEPGRPARRRRAPARAPRARPAAARRARTPSSRQRRTRAPVEVVGLAERHAARRPVSRPRRWPSAAGRRRRPCAPRRRRRPASSSRTTGSSASRQSTASNR